MYEQLVAFWGRCLLKQNIPNKSGKYGIKIWTLCGGETSYALEAQVYKGKEEGALPERNEGMRVVGDLTIEIRKHNLTCYIFFISDILGKHC